MNARLKIMDWLIKRAKVSSGEVLPKWLRFIKHVLFPFEFLYAKNLYIKYDPLRDMFTIYGIKYSGALFRSWASSGVPTGTKFILEDRLLSGFVSIRIFLPDDKSGLSRKDILLKILNEREVREGLVPSKISEFTCYKCEREEICEWAWIDYNKYRNCLADRWIRESKKLNEK